MEKIGVFASVVVTLACGALWGQNGGAVVGSGTVAPVPLTGAPGELTTVFVAGVGTGLQQPVLANTLPLPTQLAGISISFTQTDSPQGPLSVPLLAVFPLESCGLSESPPCSKLTGITLQIPFELSTGTSVPQFPPNRAQLTVLENGTSATRIELTPQTDHIHILRIGDTITTPGTANTNPSRLSPVVTHADGTLVSETSPARVGETLVLYAAGLGRTFPVVETGKPSPAPAPTASALLDLNYQPGAGPSRPEPGFVLPVATPTAQAAEGFRHSVEPVFAGLTPGFVGLYQVNFVVPPAPSWLTSTACVLTVSVGGINSFDGVPLCVEVPGGTATLGMTSEPSSESTISAVTNFTPNTIWFPMGADLRHLAKPVPPQSGGLPPDQTKGVLVNSP